MNDEWNVWELFKLDGKVALVTGGARNLGYDMALALAEAGADVAISSRTLANAEAPAQEISAATGRKVMPVQLDVTVEAQVESAVEQVLAEFGLQLPEDVDIRVVDSNQKSRMIVLPVRPEGTEGWTEDQLAEIVTRDCLIGVAVPKPGITANGKRPVRPAVNPYKH